MQHVRFVRNTIDGSVKVFVRKPKSISKISVVQLYNLAIEYLFKTTLKCQDDCNSIEFFMAFTI